MADAAVVASQVLKVAGITAQTAIVITGESGGVNQGEVLYQNNDTNGFWFRASTSNALTAGSQSGLVIALGATTGAQQPVQVQSTGRVNLGASALVAGEHYVLSVNNGKMGVTRDRLAGQFDSYIGFAIDTANLQLPANGPVAKSVARTVNG